MESKVIAFLGFLCIMQAIVIFLLASSTHWLVFKGTDSKALNPFWGTSPFLAGFVVPPAMDPAIRPIVMDLQMRLNQASAVSKSSIGLNVGIASKNIGMSTSLAKTNIKSVVNGLQNNPNVSKECLRLNKDVINQVNTESKNQLSFCTKSSQVQLKSMNQVQKDLNFQVAVLTSELNLAINQCKLENPLPSDTAAVSDCVSFKADEIREKLTNLEENILNTVSAVDTGVSQIVENAKACTQQIEEQVKEQSDVIASQLDICNLAVPSTTA